VQILFAPRCNLEFKTLTVRPYENINRAFHDIYLYIIKQMNAIAFYHQGLHLSFPTPNYFSSEPHSSPIISVNSNILMTIITSPVRGLRRARPQPNQNLQIFQLQNLRRTLLVHGFRLAIHEQLQLG